VSNVFREALVEAGITSGAQLAEHLKAPAVIFFFAGKDKRPHAELRWWDAQRSMKVSNHWPNSPLMTVGTARRRTVEAARQEAQVYLSIFEWSRSPFSNCWLPTENLQRARKEFLETPDRA